MIGAGLRRCIDVPQNSQIREEAASIVCARETDRRRLFIQNRLHSLALTPKFTQMQIKRNIKGILRIGATEFLSLVLLQSNFLFMAFHWDVNLGVCHVCYQKVIGEANDRVLLNTTAVCTFLHKKGYSWAVSDSTCPSVSPFQ